MKKIIVFFAVFAAFSPLVLLAEDVFMSISEGVSKVNIAVPKIVVGNSSGPAAEAAEVIRQVLMDDLEFTGLFSVVNPEYYEFIPRTALTDLRFNDWRSIGSDALFKGSVKMSGGNIVVEGRLFDVKTKEMMVGKRYQGEISVARKIAHMLADEFLYHYTGKKGVLTSKIAFASDRKGKKSIFVMDYDGGNVTKITRGGELNLTPSWSPDGQHIIYTSYKGGQPNLYIAESNGATVYQLTSFQGLTTGGSFSPDGRRILFNSSKDGNSEIYIMDRNGKNEKQLTNHRAIDSSPCWSPNGKQIAFTSDRSGSPQIYMMDDEGTNLHRISWISNYCDSPAWSPDGSKIAFAARKDGRFHIAVYDIEKNSTDFLTKGWHNNENPCWSKDGNLIAFASDRKGKWQIYLMRKDGSSQKAITSEGNNKTPDWGN